MLKIKQMMYLLKLHHGERVEVPYTTSDANGLSELEALGLVTLMPSRAQRVYAGGGAPPVAEQAALTDGGLGLVEKAAGGGPGGGVNGSYGGGGSVGTVVANLTDFGRVHMDALLAAPLPVKRTVWVSPITERKENISGSALPSG